MRELIAHFLDHIAYERGLSANTRAAYETDLGAFAAFLESQGHLTAFSQVTRDHIAEFLADQLTAIRLFGVMGFSTLVRLPNYVKDMQAITHDYVLMGLDLEADEEYAGMG